MRIDRKLHLVIPIVREGGAQCYVHSTPISAQVFDTYYLTIAKTHSAIFAEGLGLLSGPRVADKLLREAAIAAGRWEDSRNDSGTLLQAGVKNGLVAEMQRMTVVFAPGASGWDTVPFDQAVKRAVIDEDEASEVMAAITFFTVFSCMMRKSELTDALGGMKLWGARVESLNSTEFRNSLPTLTPGATSGAPATS